MPPTTTLHYEDIMRVTKNENGEFVIEDGPTCVSGPAAESMIASMDARDRAGNSPDQRQFMRECVRVAMSGHESTGAPL